MKTNIIILFIVLFSEILLSQNAQLLVLDNNDDVLYYHIKPIPDIENGVITTVVAGDYIGEMDALLCKRLKN